MAVNVAIFIVAILIIAVYALIEIKRLRHKIFAIFLIVLILFTYLSFYVVLKDEDIDYKSTSGWLTAGKLYVSWLSSIFGNAKSITSYAVKMDWKSVNETLT